MNYTKEQVLEALKMVKHPESGLNLVEMGMVSGASVEGKNVRFSLAFKKPNDPFKKSLTKAAVSSIKAYLGDEVEVHDEEAVSEAAEAGGFKAGLSGVKNIIGVASGKGGVGKSTIAVNLAVAVAKTGASVGLIDADVYGPSIPTMFDLEGVHPKIRLEGNVEYIVPIEKHGVKLLSIGFFVKPEDALVWRGPMATNALKQLLHQSDWGQLDYLFIDMPPGTGDIHLTIVQETGVTGAIIVSTPQQVALADAIKGISMFRGEKINVPVLGLVENMAWFTPAELPENKYYIFGKEGCKKLAEKLGIEFLGQIPVVESICEDGDTGRPSVLDENNLAGKAFQSLAAKVISEVEKRNTRLEPTKKVEITNTDGCAAVNKKEK
jgi:ATP-binding protein involved in chromosome partitioning